MANYYDQANSFSGTNVTSGGSVFQGTIRTESGAVNIDLGPNLRDQRRLDILAWLSKVQYIRHHKFAQSKRLHGTGEWLLQRKEYQLWATSAKSAIFWLCGIPGAGKTELASLIIDRLAHELKSTTDSTILYFYCSNDENDRRSSPFLIRTIIHQLLCLSQQLFEMVEMIYQKDKVSGFSHGMLDFSDSLELLTEMIAKFKKTFIVIDALDECNVDDRTEIIQGFERLSLLPHGVVKIFVTSRYSDDIALALHDHVKLFIQTQDNNNDISLFVEKEIDLAIRNKKLLRGKVDLDLRSSLKSTLTKGANGMFLWARLQITHLCDAISRADLLLALEELPSGLKETYDGIWTKIQQQRYSRRMLAERTLELLLYCVQPMSADTIAEAVTPDNPMYGHDNGVIDVELILDVCQSLVVLDAELGVLRPIHFTAQAFLKDHFFACDTHSLIAARCLRHISNKVTLEGVSKMWINGADVIVDFAAYAILNWPVHILRANDDGVVESLERNLMANEILHRLWINALRLLNGHSSKFSLLLDLLKAYPIYPDASLISACFFGLRSVQSVIHFHPIQQPMPIHPKADYFSWRPTLEQNLWELKLILSDWRIAGMVCASEQGHASIVGQLWKCIDKENYQGGKIFDSDNYRDPRYFLTCCTQLAISNGHADVLDALLQFMGNDVFYRLGVNYPYAHIHRSTHEHPLDGGPLALAAFRGQKELIDRLLSDYPNKVSSPWISAWGLQRSLNVTAGWHSEKAFSLLLNRAKTNIDLTSALCNAASANNWKVIELILDVKNQRWSEQTPYVRVNGMGDQDQTALIAAAWADSGAAAKALCRDSRVDLRCCDTSGMNALQVSVLEGHTEFLKSILERDDLDVNVRGRWGETPLILATRKGHTAVVALLLDSGKVDLSLKDMGGLTAMDVAVMKDHEPIINLLSHGREFSRKFLLRKEMDEAVTSYPVTQPIGRWSL